MNNKILLLLLIPVLFLAGCAKDEIEEVTPNLSLYNYSFLKNDNPSLSANISFKQLGNKITGNLPYNVDISNLVATFSHNGVSISIDGQSQESGKTSNDFAHIVSYKITGADGSTKIYEVDATLFTGLPMFYITTDDGAEIDSKEEYRRGDISFYGGRLFEDVSGEMKIRGRGNSTWGMHPKKPYQLKFDEKTELMGMPEDKKWIFLAEYSDKTMLRNKVAFELGYLSDLEYTPSSDYAEVFLNGKYNGTYHISQKVEESENRVDLGDDGYLLEIDQDYRLDPDDVFFYSNHFLLNIKEPELSFESSEFNFIKNYIAEFETALFASYFANSESGYEKYIDVNSFIDWYLINEITKNQDARSYSSIFMNLIPGEKLKMGPIWDFDLAFGNVNYSECEFPEGFWVKHHTWYNRLFQDPKFVTKVKERFLYYKNNEEKILEIIDQNASYLDLAQAENDDIWKTLGVWVWPNSVVLGSYNAEVDHLKSWFTTRMNWLDEAYKGL